MPSVSLELARSQVLNSQPLSHCYSVDHIGSVLNIFKTKYKIHTVSKYLGISSSNKTAVFQEISDGFKTQALPEIKIKLAHIPSLKMLSAFTSAEHIQVHFRIDIIMDANTMKPDLYFLTIILPIFVLKMSAFYGGFIYSSGDYIFSYEP